MNKKIFFWIGIAILIFLGVSYFITITSVEDGGLIVKKFNTPLLGILIFYNPFILALYCLAAVVLIVKGISWKKSENVKNRK